VAWAGWGAGPAGAGSAGGPSRGFLWVAAIAAGALTAALALDHRPLALVTLAAAAYFALRAAGRIGPKDRT